MIALNYYDPFCGDNYVNPVSGFYQPGILEVWVPGDESHEQRMVQQFHNDYSFIHELGWIEYDGQEILYMLSRDGARPHVVGSIVCFEINGADEKLRIISEQTVDDLVWFMPQLEPFGPTFISVDLFSVSDMIMEDRIDLITFTEEGGFLRSHYLPLNALVGVEDIGLISTAEDFRETISYRLRESQEWVSALVDVDQYDPRREPMHNYDGSTYVSIPSGPHGWTDTSVWHEEDPYFMLRKSE
jgi:hypothetical protein